MSSVGSGCSGSERGRSAARQRGRLVARTIDDVETPALLALVWRGAHNPPVRELLVHSRREFTRVGFAQG
ncbi:hypothetical protein [Streptomyces sp. NPDC001980]|uniref:hypothetical protein n=1 Tax=Streptomyces sp. NPDC001980 TaxID=3157126 RepID=UPI003322578C